MSFLFVRFFCFFFTQTIKLYGHERTWLEEVRQIMALETLSPDMQFIPFFPLILAISVSPQHQDTKPAVVYDETSMANWLSSLSPISYQVHSSGAPVSDCLQRPE